MKKEVAAGEMETLGSDFALLAPRTCCNDIRLFLPFIKGSRDACTSRSAQLD